MVVVSKVRANPLRQVIKQFEQNTISTSEPISSLLSMIPKKDHLFRFSVLYHYFKPKYEELTNRKTGPDALISFEKELKELKFEKVISKLFGKGPTLYNNSGYPIATRIAYFRIALDNLIDMTSIEFHPNASSLDPDKKFILKTHETVGKNHLYVVERNANGRSTMTMRQKLINDGLIPYVDPGVDFATYLKNFESDQLWVRFGVIVGYLEYKRERLLNVAKHLAPWTAFSTEIKTLDLFRTIREVIGDIKIDQRVSNRGEYRTNHMVEMMSKKIDVTPVVISKGENGRGETIEVVRMMEDPTPDPETVEMSDEKYFEQYGTSRELREKLQAFVESYGDIPPTSVIKQRIVFDYAKSKYLELMSRVTVEKDWERLLQELGRAGIYDMIGSMPEDQKNVFLFGFGNVTKIGCLFNWLDSKPSTKSENTIREMTVPVRQQLADTNLHSLFGGVEIEDALAAPLSQNRWNRFALAVSFIEKRANYLRTIATTEEGWERFERRIYALELKKIVDDFLGSFDVDSDTYDVSSIRMERWCKALSEKLDSSNVRVYSNENSQITDVKLVNTDQAPQVAVVPQFQVVEKEPVVDNEKSIPTVAEMVARSNFNIEITHDFDIRNGLATVPPEVDFLRFALSYKYVSAKYEYLASHDVTIEEWSKFETELYSIGFYKTVEDVLGTLDERTVSGKYPKTRIAHLLDAVQHMSERTPIKNHPSPDKYEGEEFDFSVALGRLKAGKALYRKGWSGTGIFVYAVPENSYPVQTGAAKEFFGENAMVPYGPYFALKSASGVVNTWVPSVSDLFAEDWVIYK